MDMNGYPDLMSKHWPSEWKRRHIMRNQTFVSVGATSKQILGPNPNRWAILISSPNANFTDVLPQTQLAAAVSITATGVKLSYTVPAGTQATLTSATEFQGSGLGTAALQLVRGASTVSLFQTGATASNVFTGQIPLTAADVIQWNETVGSAGNTADFMLAISQTQGQGRITLSFAVAAVLDQGINQYPGQTPLLLMYGDVGDAIREEINGISASGTSTIGVIDFFLA